VAPTGTNLAGPVAGRDQGQDRDHRRGLAGEPDAVLTVEITSPGNAVIDRTVYADAKIDWHLLVEPDFADYRSVTVRLFKREGGEFVLSRRAEHGETPATDEPFPFAVDTMELVDF
jgi:hypothetical protein